MPEDYPREQYAGQEIQFKVSVLSVKEKNLPELDDEFAKSVGQGFDDLAALRANIQESLTAQAEATARNDLEQKSLEALCDAAVVNASPILYERELDAMVADRERMLRQQGLDLPTYLRFVGKSDEEFMDEMRPTAERRLLSGLVLRKLAEVEEIEITDDDVQSEADRLLGMSTGEEEEETTNLDSLREFLGSESTRDNIRSSLHSRRVMERLTDIVQGKLDADADGSDEAQDSSDASDADEATEATDNAEEPRAAVAAEDDAEARA